MSSSPSTDKSPIFPLARALGMFPFTRKGQFSICSATWSLVSSVLYSFLIIGIECYMTLPKLYIAGPSRFLGALIDANRIIFILISVMSVHFRCFTHREVFQEFFRFVLNWKGRFVFKTCFVFLAISSLTRAAIMIWAIYLTDGFVDTLDLFSEILMNLYQMLIFLTALQFSTYSRLSSMRLLNLVRQLPRSCQLLHHADLVYNIQRLNNIFGLPILTLIMHIFVELTSRVYYVILTVPKLGKKVKYTYFFVDDLFGVMSMVVVLYVLIRVSVTTYEAVDAFYKELFRLMRESKTLCSNKKLCLYVSMKKTVNFTACGFFSLGYPLITSIIAAATTYLVILVQFSTKS